MVFEPPKRRPQKTQRRSRWPWFYLFGLAVLQWTLNLWCKTSALNGGWTAKRVIVYRDIMGDSMIQIHNHRDTMEENGVWIGDGTIKRDGMFSATKFCCYQWMAVCLKPSFSFGFSAFNAIAELTWWLDWTAVLPTNNGFCLLNTLQCKDPPSTIRPCCWGTTAWQLHQLLHFF